LYLDKGGGFNLEEEEVKKEEVVTWKNMRLGFNLKKEEVLTWRRRSIDEPGFEKMGINS
jgi:hypothetical protein